MEIKKSIYNELCAIRNRHDPNESCAFLFNNNTIVIEAFPLHRSPVHFGTIDPVIVQKLIEKYGNPSALFHSHPGGNRPSSRDETYMDVTMKIWNCTWLIMSNTLDLKAYKMCPMDTRDFGRLVYRVEEVKSVG